MKRTRQRNLNSKIYCRDRKQEVMTYSYSSPRSLPSLKLYKTIVFGTVTFKSDYFVSTDVKLSVQILLGKQTKNAAKMPLKAIEIFELNQVLVTGNWILLKYCRKKSLTYIP